MPSTETKLKVLTRLTEQGKKASTRWLEVCSEISRYAGTHEQWDSDCVWGEDNGFYTGDESFRVRVPKTAEAVAIFGSYIGNKIEHRQVTDRKLLAPEQQLRGRVIEKYLNQSLIETKAKDDRERCLRQNIIFGRGILWTGLDDRGIVCSRWIDNRDFICDPDAVLPRERRWGARVMRHKRYELIDKYPEARAQLLEIPAMGKQKSDGEDPRWKHVDEAHDLIEYYEVYLKVGIHRFRNGAEAVDPEPVEGQPVEQYDDAPKRYVFCKGSNSDDGVLLFEGPWEIPFWMDDSWPWATCEFILSDDGAHPIPPLAPGLGWQRLINFIDTMAVAKFRNTCRDIIVFLENSGVTLTDEQKDQILNGTDLEVVFAKYSGAIAGDSPNIKDFIQQIKFEGISGDYDRMRQLAEQRFERATGLYEVLYSGQTDTQARSAKEAEIRQSNSTSRLDDLRSKWEDFLSEVARREALVMGFLVAPEQVDQMVGEIEVPMGNGQTVPAGQVWGTLVPPPDVQFREKMEEMASQVTQQLAAAGQMAPPEAIQQMAMNAMAQTGWQPTPGRTLDDILYNHSYTIEAGSTVRKDKNQQIQLSSDLMNQTLAAVSSMPHPAAPIAVAAMLIHHLRLMEADPAVLAAIEQLAVPVPPPMPTEAAPV